MVLRRSPLKKKLKKKKSRAGIKIGEREEKIREKRRRNKINYYETRYVYKILFVNDKEKKRTFNTDSSF